MDNFENEELNKQANNLTEPQNTTDNSEECFNYTIGKKADGGTSKGIKIFALILAAVIVITGALSVGYYFGKNSLDSFSKKDYKIDIAEKPADTDELTEAEVYEKVNKSIVGIRVYNSKGAFADASGVIYSKNGYIISNDHIYAEFGAPKFKVYTYTGKEYDATYVAGDKVSDVCILKIDASGLTPAVFGNSDKLFCGEHVVAVGRPSNAMDVASITSGVVSLPRRRVKNDSNYASSYIQTDSAINPGSSGGALSNMFGQVIGITTSKLSGDEYDLVSFALPSVMMKRVVEDMLKNGKVTKRAKLGVTYTEITSVYVEAGQYGDTGLLISSVSNDSDLYKKLKDGDIITHVNGKKITSDDIILDIIEDSEAGDTITVTVLSKGGSTKDYNVKLMANSGESSYNPLEINENGDNSSEKSENGENPGSFDFPFGQ